MGCLSLHHVSAIVCTNDQIFCYLSHLRRLVLMQSLPPVKANSAGAGQNLQVASAACILESSYALLFFLIVSIGNPSLSNVSPKANEHPTWP